MPKLSVIMPVYNVEHQLEKAILSIQNQEYNDFELILIDDGSTDGSIYICDKYASLDQRIHVMHIKNSGVSVARNIGLKIARGKYIGFVDADDWVDSNMYATMIRYMEKNGSDICIGGFVNEYDHRSEESLEYQLPVCYTRNEALLEMFNWCYYRWELCDKLYRKDLINNIFLDENIAVCEDLLFNWYAFNQAIKIQYLPLHGYHYYHRVGSATQLKFSRKRLTGIVAFKKIMESNLNSDKLIMENVMNQYLGSIIGCLKMMYRYHTNFTKKEIDNYRIEIRNKLIYILVKRKKFSNRMKIGAVYFSLPQKIGVFFRRFVC